MRHRPALQRLSGEQTPIPAAEILNDRAVPFYDEHAICLSQILTDRGTEFCAPRATNTSSISRSRTSITGAPRPRARKTNGICERLHRTVLDEFYWVAFCKKIDRTIDELQTDLDAWITEYNEQRPH
jgi:transposase InsO family protein